MPIYQYLVKNNHGETVKGKVEANSEKHAASILTGRNLLVIDIKPFGEDGLTLIKQMLVGIKQTDIVNFTRQLATMISAGLPLANALSILQVQGKAEMAHLTGELLKEIEGGSTFSSALAKHPKVFSRIYVQLVRAGEVGGVLEDILNRLAEVMEKEKDFRAKTKGALIYPIIVVIAMVIVAFVMMIFVMPKMLSMFADFGAELPLPTKILIAFSNFFSKFWYVVLMAMMGGALAFKNLYKTKDGQRMIDRLILKLPIIGVLRTKMVLTDFARTLSLLLSSGVSLMESLDIVGEAIDSILYREAVINARKRVEKGMPLSSAVASQEVFPAILNQMMAVGEETGKLDEILEKLSAYFEMESSYAVKNLTAAIEPLIMIVLGIGVGLMVVAVIMPIYSLTSQF